MKTNNTLSSKLLMRRRADESGVALILVLLILVILSGLILAFFSTVTSETTASGSESSAVSAKALAENAINIVSSQIVEASRSGDKANLSSWASQPGMIRTFDQNGHPAKAYKLYSSKLLVEDISGEFKQEEIDNDWSKNTALYTDLNEPVRGVDGLLNYPIVNPEAVNDVDGFTIDTPPSGGTNALPMPVEWMYVLRDGTLRAGEKSGDNSVTVEAASKTNPIVGRIAFWTDDESCKVNINTASEGVYWDMPHIVSREDIGIMSGSTASTPGLSICQPATGEYQRYSGHPATTSLSPILKKYGLPAPDESTVPAQIASRAAAYYNILPRVAQGGSKAGTAIPITMRSTGSSAAIKPGAKRLFDSVEEMMFSEAPSTTERNLTPGTGGPLFTKETLEKVKFFLTAHSNAPEVTVFNTPRLSMWPESSQPDRRTIFDKTIAFCSSLGFMATGGEPKFPYFFQRFTVSNPNTNNNSGARSQTRDYADIERNKELFKYLTNMMRERVPGYGSSLYSKFGTDTDQIATYIFDYIRCTNIFDPSAKLQNKDLYTKLSTLASTIPMDPDNPVGYSGVSDAGGGEVLPIKIGAYQGFGRIMTINKIALIFYGTNWDRKIDSDPNGVPIPRHYPSTNTNATELAAVFVVGFSGVMHGLPSIRPNMYYTVNGLDKFKVNGQTLFPGVKDGAGNYLEGAPVRTGEGRGLGGTDDPSFTFTRKDEPIFWNKPAPSYSAPDTQAPGDTNNKPMRYTDRLAANNYPFFTKMAAGSFGTANPYDPGYVRRFIDISGPGSTFNFEGGTLEIQLYASDAAASPVQTFKIFVPNGTFRKPIVEGIKDAAPGLADAGNNNARPIWTFENAIQPASATINNPWAILTRKRDRYQTRDSDTVVSVELGGVVDDHEGTSPTSVDRTAGDLRMTAGRALVNERYWHAHQDWERTTLNKGKAYSFMRGSGEAFNNPDAVFGVLAPGMKAKTGAPNYRTRRPDVPSRVMSNFNDSTKGVLRADGGPGDWDTGYGMQKDGPYLNMPDIGDVSFVDIDDRKDQPRYPYLTKEDHFLTDQGAGNYYSPNRQIPSSMMLGSIPTGVQRLLPWQTLLFNPKPEDESHPGHGKTGVVPDHVVADFFWMPVVEPYAISQPFTTAGKINLNYQIQPFTYIKRSTGIYALMKSTKFAAMGTRLYSQAVDPRPNANPNFQYLTDNADTRIRFAIDIPATLKQFEDKFDSGDLFRIGTQICEINLYPKGQGISSASGMAAFWNNKTLTGDNLREKPYADIYPRVTTKSNSYTVHFKVQTLKKSSQSDPTQWIGGRDQVMGEYRGSALIERYIDINDDAFLDKENDFATQPIGDVNIDNFYKFRTISTKRFAP